MPFCVVPVIAKAAGLSRRSVLGQVRKIAEYGVPRGRWPRYPRNAPSALLCAAAPGLAMGECSTSSGPPKSGSAGAWAY